jgi:RNA polymerase sigma factor (sigma-70 family)
MSLFNKQDNRLITACKANKRWGQEALYKLFYTDMLRVCYRYLKSDDLAKEALNTGFLKVFQNINEFDDKKGELGAWVRVIIIRTCIDLSRKETKFTRQASFEKDAETAFITPDVLEKIYVEDLLKAVRHLPAASQLVFNMSVIEGYSHKEIGEELNISESTSRWHLTQAKKLLREILEPLYKRITDRTENPKKGT